MESRSRAEKGQNKVKQDVKSEESQDEDDDEENEEEEGVEEDRVAPSSATSRYVSLSPSASSLSWQSRRHCRTGSIPEYGTACPHDRSCR